MINDQKFKAIIGDHAFQSGAETIDQRIEENIQKRELMKLRATFQENLR